MCRIVPRMLAVAAIGSALLHAPAGAGPITFNAAITLSSGEFVIRELAVLGQSGDDPSGAERERRALAAVSVLGYGIDETLSVFAVLPYVDKRLEATVGGARQVRRARGIGDLRLFGRYTVVRENWRARVFRLSAFAGVEAPTGADDERDGLGRLPPGVQPGSGSWDPFGGAVATYQTLDFQIDGQLAYQANARANGFAFGDAARADVSFQYRLWPRQLSGGVPTFLYGVVEANLIHRRKNRMAGRTDPDSGGLTLYISPGLQLVGKRWVAEASAQLPVVQDLNGTALESGVVLRAGVRVNF